MARFPHNDRQLLVVATADQYARSGVFANYQARRARNTLRRQHDDLATFADYLAAVQFYADASDEAQHLYSDPAAMGVYGLSAHDLRHSWATRAARNKTVAFDLRDAGGWNSLAMPSRYVEAAKIANEGVKLGED